MRSIIAILCVLVYSVADSAAQCNCSGSSSSFSLDDAGSSSVALQKNQWVAEISGEYRSFAFDNTAQDHSGHVHNHGSAAADSVTPVVLKNMQMAFLGLRYGISNHITLSLQQSYVWLNADPQPESGIGDLMLVSYVKLFDRNNFSGAFLAGLEFPTGIQSKLSGENNLVIGSGSYDPVTGFVMLKSWQGPFLRANIFYKHGNSGYANTNFGSFFNHSLVFGYRQKTDAVSCNSDSLQTDLVKPSWTIFAAVSGEWFDSQVKDHILVSNTGGYMLLAGIGVQMNYKNWGFPVSCTIPLMEDMNGEQNRTNFRIKISITTKI